MKIAIVLNTSWNIYNFRMGLIKSLIKSGHEVVTISDRDKYSSFLVEAGCEFREVKVNSRRVNILSDVLLFFRLLVVYKRVKPDVILHYTIKPNIYGTLVASLLRIPSISNVCGLGTAFLNKGFVSRIAISMYKFAFRFPKLVYFQNEEDKEIFIKNNLIKEKITKILPGSGVNINHFTPSKNESNTKFTFLMISRLIYDKGIIEYINAIKQLKEKGLNIKFQLLGSKDTKHRRGISEVLINSWIENNIVDYLGSTDDVRPYINNADCIVLPSYREGTPKSLLEGASSAKPLIATNVAGCTNIVKNNINGMLCKAKDADDLAEKLKKMSELPKNRLKEMGKKGREIVESRFNEKVVIESYISAISSL